jgi:hypothetical protein
LKILPINGLTSDAQIPMQKHKNMGKKQGFLTLTKANNSTIMDTKHNEVDEISDKEFKRMIIIMINESEANMKKMNEIGT